MRIACMIPQPINTHSDYVIFIAFPLQQWLYETASVLRCTYIACLFTLFMSIVIGKRSNKRREIFYSSFKSSFLKYKLSTFQKGK